MLHLHLQKSRNLLDGRLLFVRCRLLGQPLPRASQLIRTPAQQQYVVFQASPSISNISPQVVVRKTKSWRAAFFSLFMSVSFAILLILFGPIIYFRFFTHEIVPIQTTEKGTVLGGDFSTPAQVHRQVTQPPRDENLPEGNWLIIPRIGVNTEILESDVPEKALIKGVWRVPDFAKPGDNSMPLILAAHRYGYNWWWKGEYWKYHSFYLLPNLQPGDLVEVISDKRKYLYEIYAGEEGTEITDYNSDLILYTCKFLTSNIRHFRYARLIDPSKYSDYLSQKLGSGG